MYQSLQDIPVVCGYTIFLRMHICCSKVFISKILYYCRLLYNVLYSTLRVSIIGLKGRLC